VIAGEGKRNGNNYALKENLSTYWWTNAKLVLRN
jgi:hypothetical protein